MGLFKLLLIVALAYVVYHWWRSARPAARRPSGEQGAPPDDPTRPRSAYDILGVAPGATASQVHTAYQRLIRQYHPDRVADMGPEIRAVAEQRAKEINAAYEELRHS